MNKDQLKRKGIFYLIDAISELNQKNSIPRNFKLTIAGKKGNYTEQLKKTIFKKELSEIIKVRVDLSTDDKISLFKKSMFLFLFHFMRDLEML